MSFQVRVLRRAQKDLGEIRDYVSRDAPLTAERLLEDLLDAISSLDALPERGGQPRDLRLRRLGYRFLVVMGFLILYKILGSEVRVYRVLRGRRAWEGLLR